MTIAGSAADASTTGVTVGGSQGGERCVFNNFYAKGFGVDMHISNNTWMMAMNSGGQGAVSLKVEIPYVAFDSRATISRINPLLIMLLSTSAMFIVVGVRKNRKARLRAAERGEKEIAMRQKWKTWK